MQSCVVLPDRMRVTVKFDDYGLQNVKRLRAGVVVAPSEPRERQGLYWGYTTYTYI